MARKGRGQRSRPPAPRVQFPTVQQQQAQQAQIQQITAQYAGMVPPPKMLEEFEQVVPGSAGRMMDWAADEAKHRRWMDRMFAWYRFGGLTAGTGIAVGGLVLCAYLIHHGQSGYAVAVFLAEVVSLAGIFVLGRLVRPHTGAGD